MGGLWSSNIINTFFLDEKSIQKNHDYGSVASKLVKRYFIPFSIEEKEPKILDLHLLKLK